MLLKIVEKLGRLFEKDQKASLLYILAFTYEGGDLEIRSIFFFYVDVTY